jgi:hypothetical protein
LQFQCYASAKAGPQLPNSPPLGFGAFSERKMWPALSGVLEVLMGLVAAPCSRYEASIGKSIFRIITQRGLKSGFVAAQMRPGSRGSCVLAPVPGHQGTCLTRYVQDPHPILWQDEAHVNAYLNIYRQYVEHSMHLIKGHGMWRAGDLLSVVLLCFALLTVCSCR